MRGDTSRLKRPLVESRPSAPAFAEATQRLLLLKGPIPAWMMGCLIPSILVSLVSSICILLFGAFYGQG
jgi:hypothetical protein